MTRWPDSSLLKQHTVNSSIQTSVIMMGGKLSSCSILQETKMSNHSAVFFLPGTSTYNTKECLTNSRADLHMCTEVPVTGEKEENLYQLFISLILINKLFLTRDETEVKCLKDMTQMPRRTDSKMLMFIVLIPKSCTQSKQKYNSVRSGCHQDVKLKKTELNLFNI